MSTEFRFFTLITICLLLIISCLWLAADLETATDKVKTLSIQIGDLRERNYNDSVLLSEYQEALEEYVYLDPKAADEFMRIIEKINTK